MKINPKMTGLIAKASTTFKTHSPTILMITGIVCGIGAVVTAVKATTKASEIKEMLNDELDTINETFNRVEAMKAEGDCKIIYPVEFRDKDIQIAYAHMVWGYIKTYAVPAGLEIASIACFLISHGQLKKRVASLTAACATVTDMFNRYRENVRRELGEDVDRRMRYGLMAEKIKEQIVDPETGKTKTENKIVTKARGDLPWRSDYAKVYDESCRGWVKDANQNYLTLRAQEAYCNQKLHTNGFLFLNDVYELLGIAPTEAGSEVGWIYDENNSVGDNYVDFHLEDSPDFVGGLERNIWLDFNVDGPIRHRIKWTKY